ncbi:hypothetical protein BAUCODRAFT_193874 [Baudoinia panamericana UAMH 10762]|uniref:Uncharacterized protein n=1 Tax=Baudoinia panamericana (strain UAMH 10762) TaxID=717646 RepID=M2NA20_BAUPA|nr:uncharacterized protein BAUCODRAFT_193874 [Baudoinia panamericana UAMH 10762]EMD01049.1 hypothetical protein BAUCODRAFT_193874 [Baudoinia panamericana UAMH 10762]
MAGDYEAEFEYIDGALPPKERMTAYEFLRQAEKPLPSIPSPTLTNPEMVLPAVMEFSALPSPPRSVRRPPSPSYLRKTASSESNGRSVAPKKEKRGLMSRKMMLLRSRTGSGLAANTSQQQHASPSIPSDSDMGSTYNPAYASSPTLMDVGNLAPARTSEERRTSTASSFNSEEFAGIPSFLARYGTPDGASTDDDTMDSVDSSVPRKYGYSVSIAGGLDAHRKQQEEEEHNSAILSKRAEQILANAKKRLNLMEGNLRGARDLVAAPLTAANLKRAASLGSSYHSTSLVSTGRPYNSYSQQPTRILHSQASSPTMGYTYANHARGFGEAALPERPQTALGRSSNDIARHAQVPVRANDAPWTSSLRGSRSYDSLGTNSMPVRGSPLLAKGSPDSNLEPLPEDDGSQQAQSARNSAIEDEQTAGLGLFQPASRTDDLREQMSSLKGKISTLKERAREDSLRRQSLQNLRTSSPFTNATSSPPEFFYTQSQNYGSPVLDTNAGVGRTSNPNSPATPVSMQKFWSVQPVVLRTGNAFAEQAAAAQKARELQQQQQQQQQQQEPQQPVQEIWQQQQDNLAPSFPERTASMKGKRKPVAETLTTANISHKRTPSGTAIIAPASSRYSHHQDLPSVDMPGAYAPSEAEDRVEYEDYDVSPLPSDEDVTPDYNHNVSEEEEEGSVYEDAAYNQPPVVAHEDRDDAFDYEHFFLHSAMGSYSNGVDRRHSISSEDSVSSTETARGPAAEIREDEDNQFDPNSAIYPPPTPQTPERLKEIERNLHRRTTSNDSISTLATFATATEGLESSPAERSRQATAKEWPIPPPSPQPRSHPNSRPTSRPGTAIPHKRHTPESNRDSGSDRADSGVGLTNGYTHTHDNAHANATTKRLPSALTPRSPPPPPPPPANTATTTTTTTPSAARLATPPTSPRLGDPVTIAVNALLDPGGRALGLKDKAVLFGVVESLRRVVLRLQDGLEAAQEEGEGVAEGLGLGLAGVRGRLEGARRCLDGVGEL